MSGAFPLPAARPSEQAVRPRCPCFAGAGGVGLGGQHRPHSVRSCEPALGVAGGRLAPLRGPSEVRCLSSPDCPPSRRAVGVRCPHAVGAVMRTLGPGTVPLAHVPCGGVRAAGVTGDLPGGADLSPL